MFDFYPEKTYSRTEVMSRPTPVPAVNGVYFWWFKEIPPGVPTEGCIVDEGYTLLYVGISPDKRGKPNSRSNLRKRLKTHYSGNAAGSTLRRTLGVLLSGISSFPLRRVGSGHSPIQASSGLTFGWKKMPGFTGYQQRPRGSLRIS